MSLKSFIAGDGPYYQLTGDTPARAGLCLTSGADKVGRWEPLQFIELAVSVIELPSNLVLSTTEVAKYRVSPAAPTGSKVEVLLGETVNYGAGVLSAATEALKFELTGLPAPLAFANGSTVSGGSIIELSIGGVDSNEIRPWALTVGPNGTELVVILPGTQTEAKCRGISLWYLSQ